MVGTVAGMGSLSSFGLGSNMTDAVKVGWVGENPPLGGTYVDPDAMGCSPASRLGRVDSGGPLVMVGGGRAAVLSSAELGPSVEDPWEVNLWINLETRNLLKRVITHLLAIFLIFFFL